MYDTYPHRDGPDLKMTADVAQQATQFWNAGLAQQPLQQLQGVAQLSPHLATRAPSLLEGNLQNSASLLVVMEARVFDLIERLRGHAGPPNANGAGAPQPSGLMALSERVSDTACRLSSALSELDALI